MLSSKRYKRGAGRVPCRIDIVRCLLWVAGLFVFSFVYLGLFAFRSSPLTLAIGGDYDIFRTVAYYWLETGDIFDGIFDNKGPYLFLINMLGVAISHSKWGIFILECCNLTIVLLQLAAIGRLFKIGPGRMLLAMAAFMVAFTSTLGSGDLVEEWSLPFVLLPIYLCCKYLVRRQQWHPLSYTFVYGVCLGILAFIRINNAAIIVGIVLGLAYIYLSRGQIVQLLANIVIFLGGVLVASLPALIYFYCKGSLYDMLYGTFLYNIQYREVWGSPTGKTMILNAMKMMACVFIIPAAYYYGKNSRMALLPVCLCMGVVTFYTFVGGIDYQHYFMMVTPLVFLMAVFCTAERWWMQVASLGIVLALYYHPMGMPDIQPSAFDTAQTAKLIEEKYPAIKQVRTVIPEADLDSVYTLNVSDSYRGILYHINRCPVGKYFVLQDNISNVSKEARTDVFESFTAASPKWIVAETPIADSALGAYANRYELCDSSVILIYRRK